MLRKHSQRWSAAATIVRWVVTSASRFLVRVYWAFACFNKGCAVKFEEKFVSCRGIIKKSPQPLGKAQGPMSVQVERVLGSDPGIAGINP